MRVRVFSDCCTQRIDQELDLDMVGRVHFALFLHEPADDPLLVHDIRKILGVHRPFHAQAQHPAPERIGERRRREHGLIVGRR